MISVLDTLEDTMVDGPGFRTAIYGAGCVHACPGCHNPSSWDMANGRMMSTDDILAIVKADPFADVTFTGGDPMAQARGFAELAEAIKEQTDKTIWCYTGYRFEQLLTMPDCLRLLRAVDVLVDGRFVQALRDPDLRFRGSSNQRIIDVKASLGNRELVLWEEAPTISSLFRR